MFSIGISVLIVNFLLRFTSSIYSDVSLELLKVLLDNIAELKNCCLFEIHLSFSSIFISSLSVEVAEV